MNEGAKRVRTSRQPDGTIVLEGELDAFGAEAIEAALSELSAGSDAVVDVSGVSFIDSAALRVFVRHRDRLQSAGTHLLLRQPPTAVRRLLQLSNLEEVLPVDAGSADRSVDATQGDVSR
jgi:anti-anti-sigma factor